jgi:hypothetical protein
VKGELKVGCLNSAVCRDVDGMELVPLLTTPAGTLLLGGLIIEEGLYRWRFASDDLIPAEIGW